MTPEWDRSPSRQNPPMDDRPGDAGFADRIDGTRDAFGFSLHGRNGRVAVEYGPNDDPSRWGFGVLGLPWPTEFAIGLPVLEATVSYAGEGYAAAMGWIQVVRIHVAEQRRSEERREGKECRSRWSPY